MAIELFFNIFIDTLVFITNLNEFKIIFIIILSCFCLELVRELIDL